MPPTGSPRLTPRWRSLGVLLVFAIVGGVTALPQKQPLEGTLEATAISFTVPPTLQGEGAPFLGLALRSLSLQSLGEGGPLRVKMNRETLDLDQNGSLTLEASAAKPGPGKVLYLELRLPAGAHLRQLQADGSGERTLRLDVLPPAGKGDQPPVALRITPDQNLRARISQPEVKALSVPASEFSPLVTGGVQLILTPMAPGKDVAFESALPVQKLELETETQSMFNDAPPVVSSSLRGGELHLGRREPLKLRAGQFLRIQPPGVSELTDLRLQAKGGTFSLGVVGESTGLSAGLSRKFGTTVVQGTLLSRFFSPEQIASFYGFLTGMASSVLLQLFKGD